MEDLILDIAAVVCSLSLLAVGAATVCLTLLHRNSSVGVRDARFCLLFCWFCAFFYWLADMNRIAQCFTVMPAPAWFGIACAWGYRKFWVGKRQPQQR